MSETINGLPFIEHDGEPRLLAWLHEAEPEQLMMLPPFSASGYPTLAEKDLIEVDRFVFDSPIKDQLTFGSCTNQTLTTAWDMRWRLMGRDPRAWSSTWGYANINGGQDQGASLSGILKAGQDIGFCFEQQCPQNCVFLNRVPDIQACKKTSALYRIAPDGAFRCTTYLDLLSAVVLGFPVGFGIMIGNNFDNLNSEGMCPPPDQVLGGHALCGGRTKKSKKGYWMLGFQNSWRSSWGLGGYAYVGPMHFAQRIDAWALVRPLDVTQNFDDLPPARAA